MEKEKLNIIFHIGIPRTATTFLQEEIFPKLKDINYINTSYKYCKLHPHNKVINYYLLNFTNIDCNQLKKAINNFFKINQTNLISREQLYSDAGLNPFINEPFEKRVEKIKKLKKIYPNSKIIIGTRDLNKLIISWYIKYIVNGGVLQFSHYCKLINSDMRLDLDLYINVLYKLFGKENVYVYDMENLKLDSKIFVKNLSEFIGSKTPDFKNIRKNEGYGIHRIFLSIILNNFFKTNNNPDGLVQLKSHGVLPHRYFFMSRFFKNYPKHKPSYDDLIHLENKLIRFKSNI